MEWYEYWLWFVLFLTAVGSVVNIASVGRTRPPLTGGVTASLTIYSVITLVALYLELSA